MYLINLDSANSLSKLDEEIEKRMTRLVGDHGEGVLTAFTFVQFAVNSVKQGSLAKAHGNGQLIIYIRVR